MDEADQLLFGRGRGSGDDRGDQTEKDQDAR